MAEHVENRVTGPVHGNVVQARDISGGVVFHQSVTVPGAVDRRSLLDALRAATVPLRLGGVPRSAFQIAPHRLVTFGTDVSVQDGGVVHHPVLHGAVEPGDELWALGYPRGDEARADVIGLRCPGVLDAEQAGAHPLDLLWGTPGVGSTGGPVLNWRTGAVCGLFLLSKQGVWLVTAAMVAAAVPGVAGDRAWLDLMDDDQLRACGVRYPGARLRAYLSDVRQLGEGHPYLPMVQQGPSLTEFYLPQHLYHESDGTHRVTADALARRHQGAQVMGDPGVGKSSLVRHLAAASAQRWLTEHVGDYVPVPVSARALAAHGSLPVLLADGVLHEVATVVDAATLAAMFEKEPMPGVPWLVLVDGLDEVLNEFDRRVVLDRLLSRRGGEAHRFLVTSRPLGGNTVTRLSQRFPAYVIEPFDEDELARFAHAWFTDAGRRDVDALVGRFMAEVARSELGRLARVPLVSMMLCMLFADERADSLPRSQYAVYERFFAVLTRKLETSGLREEFRRRAIPFGAAAETAVARLVTGLPGLLEDIAVARQGLVTDRPTDTRPVLDQAVARSSAGRPEAVPRDVWTELVAEALRASGLLVQRGAEFRFLHQTIEEYLAAKHIAVSADSAWRRKMLAPRTVWPWPHLEVTVFVVALWTAGGVDLTPQYNRLLARRHREVNVGFVVELARRGVALPNRVVARAAEVLAARVLSHRTMARDWLEAVHWLAALDPHRAGTELVRLVDENPAHDRAAEAVQQLVAIDRARGIALAHAVVVATEQSREKRLLVATHVLAADVAAGVDLYARLAAALDNGVIAVEAAERITAHDHERGVELLAWQVRSSAVPVVALAAGRALLRRQPEAGVAALDRERTGVDLPPENRLALADEVARVDARAAEWRYRQIAEDGTVEDGLRLRAAQRLVLTDPERAGEVLTWMAHDPGVDWSTRLAAASSLAAAPVHDASALASLAKSDGLPAGYRLEAAHLLEKTDADLAGRLVADIGVESDTTVLLAQATNESAPFADRLTAVRKLGTRGHTRAVISALMTIAVDKQITGQTRLEAAGLLSRHEPDRAADVYETIAMDYTESGPIRIAAADWVMKRDRERALQLYLLICAYTAKDLAARMTAATRAGALDPAKAVHALADILREGGMSHHLETITRTAVSISPDMALHEWKTVYVPGATNSVKRAIRGS